MKKVRSKNRRAQAHAVAKRTLRGLDFKCEAHKRRYSRSKGRGQLRSQRKDWQRGGEEKRHRWGRRNPSRTPLVVLDAPSHFTLSDAAHRSTLLQFLSTLKRLTLKAHKPVRIDFGKTRKMFPDGVLVFAAELDVILSSADTPPVRCTRPADRVVDQLLQQLGLATKMKLASRSRITADNVKYWRVQTDTRVDGSLTEDLIKDYREHFSGVESKKLYEGLTEAMTNAKQHAYEEDATATAPRWWMFSQLRKGKLSVSFCDLGMGFRNSLTSDQHWAKKYALRAVDALGGGRTDAHFIRVAFEVGKSRTNEPHRGKGLEELKRVIESVGGHLRILSHKGNYFYSAAS